MSQGERRRSPSTEETPKLGSPVAICHMTNVIWVAPRAHTTIPVTRTVTGMRMAKIRTMNHLVWSHNSANPLELLMTHRLWKAAWREWKRGNLEVKQYQLVRNHSWKISSMLESCMTIVALHTGAHVASVNPCQRRGKVCAAVRFTRWKTNWWTGMVVV